MTEKNWASSNYSEEKYDTVDIELSNGEWVRINQMSPIRLIALVDKYEVTEIAGEIDEGNVSEAELEDELSDVGIDDAGNLASFLRDVILPRIIRPENAHWANPPDDPTADEVFDLSDLDDEDIHILMNEMTASGDGDRMNESGQYEGRFQGESSGHRTRDDGRKVRETTYRGGGGSEG